MCLVGECWEVAVGESVYCRKHQRQNAWLLLGAVAVFAAKTFSLDDWATGWIGGFISAGVLAWLIKNDKRRT